MRTLDLFCGGGGSSYGAKLGGANIICGIDLWKTATENFKNNFPEATTINSRLEDVDPKLLHRQIGDIDLLLASPECTNHTCAKGSAPRSEESRATALQTYRFAKEFRPRRIVMENVVHMKPWSRYGELKDAINGLGYKITECTLDASEFGVPQKRRRLFLICDLELQPVAPIPSSHNRRKTVKSILDRPNKWKTSLLRSPKRAVATLERAERGFKSVGNETPFLVVYYGTDGSGGWQALDRPLRTITTVDRFALIAPSDDGHTIRMLQVPELRRAMGFDRKYRLDIGTRREKVKILGNGVCPPIMTNLVKQFLAT